MNSKYKVIVIYYILFILFNINIKIKDTKSSQKQ